MAFITNLTRMWLTRSTRPFVFTNDCDRHLPYSDCKNLGLYVHIPFCRSLCHFCPYCKVLYNKEQSDRYLDALLGEIRLVGSQTAEKMEVSSLYFGGGSPALAADRLKEIIACFEEYFVIKEGIGVELHPDELDFAVLKMLKEAGVSKISIGIQSFQEKYQRILGRSAVDASRLREVLAAVPFETVSMDFIFALPDQSLKDLQADIDEAFASGANHIAIYPFIDFTFTETSIPAMTKNEKHRLLNAISRYCLARGYVRKSIWTFSADGQASYSSMTRDYFLGFGCSATSLLRDQFKINTFSVEDYCKRVDAGTLPTSLTLRFSLRQRMIYYLFWTAYSTKLSEKDFEAFFGLSLKKYYGLELRLAKFLGYLKEDRGVYEMTLKGAFFYHYYENFYTLAYIDKMWGILRKEAFPERIEF